MTARSEAEPNAENTGDAHWAAVVRVFAAGTFIASEITTIALVNVVTDHDLASSAVKAAWILAGGALGFAWATWRMTRWMLRAADARVSPVWAALTAVTVLFGLLVGGFVAQGFTAAGPLRGAFETLALAALPHVWVVVVVAAVLSLATATLVRGRLLGRLDERPRWRYEDSDAE